MIIIEVDWVLQDKRSYNMTILTIISIIVLAFIILRAILLFKSKHKSYKFINDIDVTDIPFVTIEIQGVKCNFIVDSGADASIISPNFIDENNIIHKKAQNNYSLISAEGKTFDTPIAKVPLVINHKLTSEIFALNDNIENIFSCDVKISGLLGSPFLNKHQCKIDYKNHKLDILE
jgi:hypothetical protein